MKNQQIHQQEKKISDLEKVVGSKKSLLTVFSAIYTNIDKLFSTHTMVSML